MADFFISYNVADFKKAEWIAWILREAGYSVRFAHREIGIGGDIAQWMERALQDSRAMICVASPDYLKPQAKYSALERAAMLWQDVAGTERRLIFVKVRTCALPVLFATRQYINIDGMSRDQARSTLLAGARLPVIPNFEPAFDDAAPAVAAPEAEPDFKVPSLLIDTSALPDVSLVTLRGRDDELARLDAALADPSIHVFSVVAWGGWGKTALVSVWADRLKAEAGRGAEAILAWSFYSQGTKERATSADRFLDWALKKLNLKDPGPSARLKADTIAEALKRRRVLLILDGVEPLQHGPGPQEGQLKDPAMRVLLRRVADGGSNGGLVIVTSRLDVKDLERWKATAAPVLDLRSLSDALAPLFQAIPHGCKAGRQHDALMQVYIGRICRLHPDGRIRFYAQNTIGAIGPCLAAVAWFFDKPFEKPHDGLTESESYWVLAEAARLLGYLGRLGQALRASRTCFEMVSNGGSVVNAARIASNLSETELGPVIN
jgi:hypothetical protein